VLNVDCRLIFEVHRQIYDSNALFHVHRSDISHPARNSG
jgi:hypothetical protein